MCITKPSFDHDEKENEAHLKQFLYALPSQLYSCWVWLVLKKHIFEACKLFCVLWMSSINQWFIESFWHHQCNWGQLMQPMRQPTNQPKLMQLVPHTLTNVLVSPVSQMMLLALLHQTKSVKWPSLKLGVQSMPRFSCATNKPSVCKASGLAPPPTYLICKKMYINFHN